MFFTGLIITTNIFVFKSLGAEMLLMINFEGVFILKESLLAYYQLSKNKEISGFSDLFLQIIETALKILQWLQIGVIHGNIFSTTPVDALLILKLQSYVCALYAQTKQYFKYKTSIEQFVKLYPALSSNEVQLLNEDKCCICWNLLNIGESCKITCGHVLHIECIWKWMLRNTERRCPMCKQNFLQPLEGERNSLASWINSVFRRSNQTNQDITRIREMFPHLTEIDIIIEIERTGSVQAAIDSFLGD